MCVSYLAEKFDQLLEAPSQPAYKVALLQRNVDVDFT